MRKWISLTNQRARRGLVGCGTSLTAAVPRSGRSGRGKSKRCAMEGVRQ